MRRHSSHRCSSSLPAVAHAGVVLLVFLALCSFSLSSSISFVVRRPISMVLVIMEIPQLRVDTVVDGPFLQSCSSLSCRRGLSHMPCCAGLAVCRHPGQGAEAVSHGLACSEGHRDSAVQYFSWWWMPLSCGSCEFPVLLQR